MAEELNLHFSAEFPREDSSIPVPEKKFIGTDEERLGQLVNCNPRSSS